MVSFNKMMLYNVGLLASEEQLILIIMLDRCEELIHNMLIYLTKQFVWKTLTLGRGLRKAPKASMVTMTTSITHRLAN